MRLYIARHGQASFNAENDHARALTPTGIQETERLFNAHRQEFEQMDHIWVSPLVRAQQTAGILSGHDAKRIETTAVLTPDEEPESVVQALESISLRASVLLVSHQPLIGELVSLLVHGNLYDPHPFTTSEMVVLDLPSLTPGAARMVADYLPGH
jgi:phosphohistidine phosphatase